MGSDSGSTTVPEQSSRRGSSGRVELSLVWSRPNEFRWSEVRAPKNTYLFERKKILAIQFHVPAAPMGTPRSAYDFCVSALTFLRD